MKIFVNARFLTQPVSGVQRYGIECSRQIKKLYPDAVFVAPQNILHAELAKELGVQIIGSRSGHIWEQLDLPRYLRRNGTPPLLSLANTAPVSYANNFFTLHDLAFRHHPEWNSRAFSLWYNWLIPRLAKGCRHMFTVSETVKKEIIAAYNVPQRKISVTCNGISQNMQAAHKTNVVKEKVILSVGTFNIRKNHPKLISGYLDSSLIHSHSLVLIGDKNKVFREGGIDEETLEEAKIKIVTSLTEEELINMYQKAEIVASLSLYEGFGIPILEGLFNGCKILCSDIPVYHELYDGYATFCNPTDVDEIAAAFNKVAAITSSPAHVNDLLAKYNYTRAAQVMIDAVTSVP